MEKNSAGGWHQKGLCSSVEGLVWIGIKMDGGRLEVNETKTRKDVRIKQIGCNWSFAAVWGRLVTQYEPLRLSLTHLGFRCWFLIDPISPDRFDSMDILSIFYRWSRGNRHTVFIYVLLTHVCHILSNK